MAQSQQRPRRFNPRPATDPQRWSRVSGGVLPRRARQPQAAGMPKLVGMLGGGKSAGRNGKGGRRGGAAGGVAMLTTVAGLAYRTRDKLAGVMNRRGGPQPAARRQ